MKPSRAYAMAVGVVLSCSSFFSAQPKSMIDQEQPAINNTGGFTLAIGGLSTEKLAQVFTASRNGFLTHVTMKAGIQYAIVLKAVGNCAILPAIDGDSYSGGHGYYDALPNPPGWVALSSTSSYDDLPFQTFVLSLR